MLIGVIEMVDHKKLNRIIRMREVCLKTGLSQSTIQSKMSDGLFPKSFKLVIGGRAAGWYEADINQYLSERRESVASMRANHPANTEKNDAQSGGAR